MTQEDCRVSKSDEQGLFVGILSATKCDERGVDGA